LLSGGVVVFISRTHARLDWLPMAWAACIFIAQLQYWWAVIELASFNETWTIGTFLLLLGLPLMLFAAAALVLPQTELPEGADLREWFNRDGRWALLFLCAYYILAVLANWILWKHSPLSSWDALEGPMIVLPLAFNFISSRRAREIITVLFIGLTLWECWQLSPKSY
jgi:hypothetical protein